MKQRISAAISDFVSGVQTDLEHYPTGPYFDVPLVGFAATDDPLFSDYKKIIGDFHLTPAELFDAEFGAPLRAGTVICWILPIGEAVRRSNRLENDYPSRQWSLTRTHGEALNGELRRYLVSWLTAEGYKALAPQYSPAWRELADTPVGRASTWSERHAAYAAGLGTFSLSDALITAKGIAHRCGSVITDLVLEPSPRDGRGYGDNCLFLREGSCGACIGRCPVGAISFAGHDKVRCCDYVYGKVPAAVGEKYGVPYTGCGLCQTRVPCESGIPGKTDN
ncbi:MAG TPA: epoxyqueuosine reductase [Geobacteraceae bacterium]|nr:epoxyqueuosine reductase [Geobacteraceae bacterium]